MPIEGPEDPDVTVIREGKEVRVHRDMVKPYDLDRAQAVAVGARGSKYISGDPNSVRGLQFTLGELQDYDKAASEVVQACEQEISQLKDKRRRLHSPDAAANFDGAISGLETERKRHLRMRSRLHESMRDVRRMLAECRDAQTHPRIRAEDSDG